LRSVAYLAKSECGGLSEVRLHTAVVMMWEGLKSPKYEGVEGSWQEQSPQEPYDPSKH